MSRLIAACQTTAPRCAASTKAISPGEYKVRLPGRNPERIVLRQQVGKGKEPEPGDDRARAVRGQVAADRHRDHQGVEPDMRRARGGVGQSAERLRVGGRPDDQSARRCVARRGIARSCRSICGRTGFRIVAARAASPPPRRRAAMRQRSAPPSANAAGADRDGRLPRRGGGKTFIKRTFRTSRHRFAPESDNLKADGPGSFTTSTIATARVQPAEARSIFTGKQATVKPVDGSASRLCSFSMWQ